MSTRVSANVSEFIFASQKILTRRFPHPKLIPALWDSAIGGLYRDLKMGSRPFGSVALRRRKEGVHKGFLN